jgi:hypothetical protein
MTSPLVRATVTLVTDRTPSREEHCLVTFSAWCRSPEKQSHGNGLTIDLTQLILDISSKEHYSCEARDFPSD